MYAIIPTGGKQYRVAPGDVIQVEKRKGETVEFPALDANARVTGAIKHYQRLSEHRQSLSRVKIQEIVVEARGPLWGAPRKTAKQSQASDLESVT